MAARGNEYGGMKETAMTDHEEPTTEALPVGAYLASALMAANIPCDSGEDVDRLIAEMGKRGLRLAIESEARATATPGLDVERLANAYENVTESMGLRRGLPMIAWLAVAAEYDRLAADSEPVDAS
jgi:hypothetical protein